MAFRTDGGTFGSSLAIAFRAANDIAKRVKSRAQRVRDNTAAGDVPRREVWALVNTFDDANLDFGVIAAVPGIAQFARDQYDDPAYDIVAEFTTMRQAIRDSRDWIIANGPTTAANEPIENVISGTRVVSRIFTTAQTVGLRTELDTLIATID